MIVARLEDQERRLREAQAHLLRDVGRQLEMARARLAGLAGSSGLARVPQRVKLYRERLRRANELLQRDVDRVVGERPIVAASESMIEKTL